MGENKQTNKKSKDNEYYDMIWFCLYHIKLSSLVTGIQNIVLIPQGEYISVGLHYDIKTDIFSVI